MAQVRSTAPFLAGRLPAPESARLIDIGGSPDGFLRVLASWENLLRSGLTPDEQLLFSRLAIFVGGCTVEAAGRAGRRGW